MEEWLLSHHGSAIYPLLFLFLLGGAIGLPIPEDLPLLGAGVLIHEGRCSGKLAFITCYLGIILGDIIIYQAGRRIGPALFRKRWFRERFSEERIEEVRKKLERRSVITIFVARHLFYLRSITFLVCGAVNMGYARFLLADMFAALVSAPLMMGIGYLGARQLTYLLEIFTKIKMWSLAFSIVFALFAVLYLRRRGRKLIIPPVESTEPTDGPPCI